MLGAKKQRFVYRIKCRECNTTYFSESGKTCNQRIYAHISYFKNKNESFKLVIHVINTDRVPDSDIEILHSHF